MHAVTVELDFMQPLVAFRRRVNELGQLRRDPLRQTRAHRQMIGALPAAPCREREGIAAPKHGLSLRGGKLGRSALAVGCQFR